MRRKGQFLSLITVFLFIFIVSGNIFAAVMANEEFSRTVTFNTGDINYIAEARIKGDLYVDRAEAEMNYTANTVAVELGSNGGSVGWSNDPPSADEVISVYEDGVSDSMTRQIGVHGCSPPAIGSVSVDGSEYSASIEGAVKCSAGTTVARVPPRETSIATINPNNTYTAATEYAVDIADAVYEIQDSISGTGTATYDTCPSGDSKSDAETAAMNNAESDAESSAGQDINDAVNSVAQPPIFSISHSSTFSGSEGSYSEEDIGDCTYEVKVGDDENGDPIFRTRYGDKYRVTATYEVTGFETDISIEDTEHLLITHDSMSDQLAFEYTYSRDLNG